MANPNLRAPFPDDVLVVDDAPENLDLLERLLVGAGYQARTAEDGELALRSARARPPSLILLDIRMPRMNGYEVCRRLKEDEATRAIPIIFISVLGDENDKLKSFEAGGVDYINKPFHPLEVLARVKTHLTLRRMQSDLERRNDELTRFTFTASHDLEGPLATVTGSLWLIRDHASKGALDKLRWEVDRAARVVARMNRLLDALLKLSRAGHTAGPPVEVRMSDLAKDAVELLSGAIGERGVKVVVAPDLPVVWGDEPRLLQVFENLIGNAVKFMGDQCDPRIEIGVRRDCGEDVFHISDNGIGIDAPHLEAIFDIFKKVNPASPGTGIGLATVKRIVEAHGGRVWVESDGAGKGASFCFTVPSRDDLTAHASHGR